jgi:hypothetical protein
MLKQVQSPSESAEHLLQALESEIALRRKEREKSQGKRMAVLAGGLLLIVGGTTVALCALFSSLTGLIHDRSTTAQPPAAVSQR